MTHTPLIGLVHNRAGHHRAYRLHSAAFHAWVAGTHDLGNRRQILGFGLGLAVSGAALLGLPAGSQATLLRYSASGSGISGTLGGELFSDATWLVSALADSDDVMQLTIPTGPGQQIEAWLLKPVSPNLQLNWAGGQRQAALQADPPFDWSILSGKFPTGPSPKIGFVYANPSFTNEHAAGLVGLPFAPNPSLFNDLMQPVTLTSLLSVFETNSYPTSSGSLVITSATIQPGTFRIDAVPSPLPVMGTGMALSWSRRLRRRCRHQPGSPDRTMGAGR